MIVSFSTPDKETNILQVLSIDIFSCVSLLVMKVSVLTQLLLIDLHAYLFVFIYCNDGIPNNILEA